MSNYILWQCIGLNGWMPLNFETKEEMLKYLQTRNDKPYKITKELKLEIEED